MQIVAWLLIVLGVLAFLGGLAIALNEQFKKKPGPAEISAAGFDPKSLEGLIEKLAQLMEQFGKLSAGIQWAFLGLVSIGVGTYLMMR